MKPINEVRTQFMSCSVNEGFSRMFITAFISQLDPTIEEVADIKTAVSEAVTNCIVHGYKDTIGWVYITVKIYENGKVRIVIRDRGCGIPDVKKAMEPLYTSESASERAGMGFTVMQSFMDKLRVRSAVEKGTSVTLEKTIQKR